MAPIIKDINVVDLRKYILYPVIAGVLLMFLSAAVMYLTTVGANKQDIKDLEASKVDQEKFNQFVKIYGEFLVLTEERHRIINTRLDVLEERQRQIELERLKQIETNITRLQENMKTLLKEYGFYTRDGSEVKINPLMLIDKT